MENTKGFKVSQYACAVLLIVSSIALVAYQVVHIDDVASGLLYYVAQSEELMWRIPCPAWRIPWMASADRRSCIAAPCSPMWFGTWSTIG